MIFGPTMSLEIARPRQNPSTFVKRADMANIKRSKGLDSVQVATIERAISCDPSK